MTEHDFDNILHPGLPRSKEYHQLVSSRDFLEMKKYSDEFIKAHPDVFKSYSQKWVIDPLYQWSRRWEYPFMFHEISEMASSKQKLKILDAGSGLTFFPYYLMHCHPHIDMFCCDYDKKLIDSYELINKKSDSRVTFTTADLRNLKFSDNEFDIIYCVSVLEHTNEYPMILDEFHRILKPGGKAIITFDVSLDGSRDISIEQSAKLTGYITKKFSSTNCSGSCISSLINSEDDLFTTDVAASIDQKLLPWKYPEWVYRIKHLLSKKRSSPWQRWPPLLTVYCISARK